MNKQEIKNFEDEIKRRFENARKENTMADKSNHIENLMKVRKEIQPIKRDGKNPHFKSNYATLDNVIETVTSPLDKYGFFLTHHTFGNEHGMFVRTHILYKTGEMIVSTDIPIVLHKQDMQALGGAITYARRYGILSLLNLPTEDDDANYASAAPTKQGASNSKPVQDIWKINS